jgi:hypothetical protein
MIQSKRGFLAKAALLMAGTILFLPLGTLAQGTAAPPSSAQSTTSAGKDRWLHVRVVNTDAKGETVRVNVPLELAEKVLPAVNHDRLHNGKVKIDCEHMNDVDLRALVDAIRTAKDGEYVTVQGSENDVRVAKQGGFLLVHVMDHGRHGNSVKDESSEKSAIFHVKENEVEIKVPMKVIDALFSAGKDELDLVAALHALSAQGDTELVSVKDHQNTVRVWLDSKNVAD